MDHINALIEISKKEQPEELKPWIERRLERELSPEEHNYLLVQHLKPKLLKIFRDESSYLNEEEIAHRISMVSKGLLDIPSLLKMEKAWSIQEKSLNTEDKINSFLDHHLLNI